jgi:predicted O-methyltransferase YrrM
VPVAPTTGRFLFSLVAPQIDCEVLEIGAGHGYSTIWLAAGVCNLGGRVLSLERDEGCVAEWRRNIAGGSSHSLAKGSSRAPS